MQISGLMDKFEKEFEDLDVQTSVMENTMGKEYIHKDIYIYIDLYILALELP